MTDTTVVGRPEWTEYRTKNGLDPLGMQNSSVGLYQRLLPGISNVTLRIRYYGFYAWLSLVYAKKIGDTNPKSWQRFVRRAEALYALVGVRQGAEHGVAGIQWAQRKLNGEPRNISFDEDAEPGSPTYYLKQAWGAYGAAYGGQLFEVGILSTADNHGIPLPSREVGEALAENFESELGGIADRYIAAIARGHVRLDELDTFVPMTPSGIRASSPERQFYEDLLFAKTGLQQAGDIARRKTLLLILLLADKLGRPPDIGDVRWALYANCLDDGKELAIRDTELEAHRRRWHVYQANDLTHLCLEALLRYVLDALAAYPGGVPLERLISQAASDILAANDTPPKNWLEFRRESAAPANAWAEDNTLSEVSLADEVLDAAQGSAFCGVGGAWAALRLLAVLHNRMEPSIDEARRELVGLEPPAFRSIVTEVTFLESVKEVPFARTIERLLEERVIQRHIWIAMRKLRYQSDYTFLIEVDNGRVRLRGKDGPVFTNPRLGPALTFVTDLHLLGEKGLTTLGRSVVRKP